MFQMSVLVDVFNRKMSLDRKSTNVERVLFTEDFTFEAFDAALSELEHKSSAQSALVFIADGVLPIDAIHARLAASSLRLIGGIFPGLLHENKAYTTGFLMIGLHETLNATLIPLNNKPSIIEHIREAGLHIERYSQGALITFVDALAEGKGDFIEAMYNQYGITIRYMGGGAGSLSFQQMPCILSNQGISMNSAVIAWCARPIEIGVAHGWEPVSAALKVTEVSGRELISLNWRPAFEVYQEIVETHASKSFDDMPFFDLAKSYPFGKALVQGEFVIRDPFATNQASISLVDEVHEGEFLHVMHGQKASLLAGARAASQLAREADQGVHHQIFCIDCISRSLFLGDEFGEELQAIANTEQMFGILSIGEIANTGGSYLELFNKTVVVARL
jgi:hypothetical protein